MGEPLIQEQECTPSPKKRRLDADASSDNVQPSAAAHPPSSTGSSCKEADTNHAAPRLTAEQLERIEQNRRAAISRKKGLTVEQYERIEQNRRAAMARKQGAAVEHHAKDEQTGSSITESTGLTKVAEEIAASASPQSQKLDTSVPALMKSEGASENVTTLEPDNEAHDGDSSATPPTPELGSAPSTPSSVAELLTKQDFDSSDECTSVSESSSSGSSSSSGESDSDSDSDSSSASESDSPEPTNRRKQVTQLTAAQRARMEQNRRAAIARKRGLTVEQIEKIEQNRRLAMARKRGLTSEQIEKMEMNRRAALARKKGLSPEEIKRMEENRHEAAARRQQAQKGSKGSSMSAELRGIPEPKPAEERDARQKLVAKLLCRWWYAMPPWPPEDYDWATKLAERRCRSVEVEAFHKAPELDEKGFRKVYELANYRGLYRSSDGELIDLRPIEGKPSYAQMMLKSTPDLYRLLIKAYDAQLMELFSEANKNGASTELHKCLEDLRREASESRSKATFYLMFSKK